MKSHLSPAPADFPAGAWNDVENCVENVENPGKTWVKPFGAVEKNGRSLSKKRMIRLKKSNFKKFCGAQVESFPGFPPEAKTFPRKTAKKSRAA